MPALPDAQRLTSYSLSAGTCTCSVGFAIYGDGTDVDAWIDVFINGTAYLSTDPAHGWSLSSATGSLGSIPRPITNAQLTFAAPQTGTVVIVGARRPRRTSQFPEDRGVDARSLNQVITDIISQNREVWDEVNGTVRGQPGEVLLPLPSATFRAGQALIFDANGNPTVATSSVVPPVSLLTGNNVWTGNNTFTGLVTLDGPPQAMAPTVQIGASGYSWLFPTYTDPFGSYLSVTSPNGNTAILAATRTSDYTVSSPVQDVIASQVYAIHDKTAAGSIFGVWGNYWLVERTATADPTPVVQMLEASIVNNGNVVASDPFQFTQAGITVGLTIDSGKGIPGPNLVSSAMHIGDNAAQFGGGIAFGTNAIANGPSGFAEAIQLAAHVIGSPVAGQAIVWYGGPGVVSSVIETDINSNLNLHAGANIITNSPLQSLAGVSVGTGAMDPTVGLIVHGPGATNATYAVSFGSSTGGALFQVRDDGELFMPMLPGSAGSGGLTVCVDSTGIAL